MSCIASMHKHETKSHSSSRDFLSPSDEHYGACGIISKRCEHHGA